MNITIMGAGSWGTTLAHILAQRDHSVTLWARKLDLAEEITTKHTNTRYLKGINLNPTLKATASIKEALHLAEIVIIVIPSAFVRDVATKMREHLPKTVQAIISASKGLEQESGKRMSQVIQEECHNVPVAVLTGPNHAEEVCHNIPTATVLASDDKAMLKLLTKELSTPHFKVYPIDDVAGAEYCGALKNVCAIAVGVSNGLNLGDNAKGSIMTLGLAEMARVGRVFGAKRETYYGLAGVGDLIATCTSKHSRNRFLGEQLAHHKTFDQISTDMNGMIAEGAHTAKVLHKLAQDHNLTLPLTEQVYQLLYKEKNVEKAVHDLLTSL